MRALKRFWLYDASMTAEYLYRYQGKMIDIDAVYRFLDRLSVTLKPVVEQGVTLN
jgi:hypothetical protein